MFRASDQVKIEAPDGDQAKDQAEDVKQKGKGMFGNLKDSILGGADKVKEGASDTADRAKESASRTSEQASSSYSKSSSTSVKSGSTKVFCMFVRSGAAASEFPQARYVRPALDWFGMPSIRTDRSTCAVAVRTSERRLVEQG